MPFIHVRLAVTPTPDQTARIRKGITHLMAGTLRKKAELTAVLVEPLAPGASWGIGGEPVLVAAHVDATVTQGTNTESEKAEFVGRAHELLRAVLGNGLPLATYVVVTEVAGENWGYAGLTQSHRAVLSRAASSGPPQAEPMRLIPARSRYHTVDERSTWVTGDGYRRPGPETSVTAF